MRNFLPPFLIGLYANIAQLALARFLFSTFHGNELHLGTILGFWLLGTALGGYWSGKRAPTPTTVLVLLLIAPWLSLAVLAISPRFLPPFAGNMLPFGPFLALVFLASLPPACASGALIPSLVHRSGASFAQAFSLESAGGFIGGILTAFVLEGRLAPVPALIALPVIPLLLLTVRLVYPWRQLTRICLHPDPAQLSLAEARQVLSAWPRLFQIRSRIRLLMAALFCLPLLLGFFGEPVRHKLQQYLWQHIHPGITLVGSFETPDQKVDLGEYHGQQSLFLDGSFAQSWPDPGRAEERIHPFMTAIASPGSLLVVGCPSPDLIDELAKYPGLRTVIVESDDPLRRFFADLASTSRANRIWHHEDPRVFLRRTNEFFDGILLLPADPSTLLANRLFTRTAFADMKARLAPGGIVGVSVTGTENYIGGSLERSLLTTYHTLRAVFPDLFAIPGDPIQFWAAAHPGTLATDPRALGARFTERRVPTLAFRDVSFENLLPPFRVTEVQQWLQRPLVVALNEDTHPAAFSLQIRLWDVFSGSQLGAVLERLEQVPPPLIFGISALLSLVFCVLPRLLPKSSGRVVLLGGTTFITGFAALFTELILLFLFQTRCGSMVQMLGFFFGLYMLGLSLGALLPGRFPANAGYDALLMVKTVQLGLLLLLWFALPQTHLHEMLPTAGFLFLFALTAGAEFLLLAGALKTPDAPPGADAGRLFCYDNLGAFLAALVAGPWLLPIVGLSHSLLLLLLLLAGNLGALLLSRSRLGAGATEAAAQNPGPAIT
jgi:spermidine synthase